MRHQPLAILCACLMLAACGTDKTATPSQQSSDESLPQPDVAGGSVTGMPNPGAPSAQPALADDLATDNGEPGIAAEDGSVVDPKAPVNTPEAGNMDEIAIPSPETMPTMPAPTPDPVESRIPPPPES